MIAKGASAANPRSVSDRLVINLALSGSLCFIADRMAAGLKRHFRPDIAIVANLNCAISVDFEVLADPAVPANGNEPRSCNGAHNGCSFPYRASHFSEQPALHAAGKRLCSDKEMIDQKQVYPSPDTVYMQSFLRFICMIPSVVQYFRLAARTCFKQILRRFSRGQFFCQ